MSFLLGVYSKPARMLLEEVAAKEEWVAVVTALPMNPGVEAIPEPVQSDIVKSISAHHFHVFLLQKSYCNRLTAENSSALCSDSTVG